MQAAWEHNVIIPAFNVPYVQMIEPIIRALRDTDTFGLIELAYIEWMNFEVENLEAVHAEYQHHKQARHTRLHLDHIPVISEDDQQVDYLEIISRAINVGYESVMVDGSKLNLEDNIAATRTITDIAHAAGVPVEGELGSIVRLGSGPIPPYEELFAARQGFTIPDEAVRYVEETDVDWLSVSVGSIHGSISSMAKKDKKLAAKLDIEHLAAINARVGIPLVLHGGSGIPADVIRQAVQHGITKINVAFVVRAAYEAHKDESVDKAQDAVYNTALQVIDELGARGSSSILF
jgi:fructose/tagatose bisphosphate aldolase